MGTRNIWLLPNAGQVMTGNAPRGVQNGPLYSAWADGAWDNLNESGRFPCGLGQHPFCSWAWFAPSRNGSSDVTFSCEYEDPPAFVTFNRVKLVCVWDYSARPSNPYVFPQGVPDGTGGPFTPPTNAHGPRSRIVFRNRADTGFNVGPWWNAGFRTAGAGSGSPQSGNHYCHINRTNCANRPAVYGGHSKVTMSWELTSHPEGGVWSFNDLLTLQAGIQGQTASPGWEQFGGVAFVRVRYFHYYVEVEVTDAGAFVSNLRHATSHSLRIARRPRNSILTSVPASESERDLGAVSFLSHPRGVSSREGWPEPRLQRRPAQVLRRTYWPESLRVIDELLDLHDIRCTAWAAFRVGIPWAPELSGMSYLDQSGGFVHERLQDAWTPRPGDRVLTRIPEKPDVDIERPYLSEDGLACSGPDDNELGAFNTNPDPGLGGWTLVAPVSMTVTDDDTGQIAEELGYETSQSVVYGAGGSGRVEQVFLTAFDGWLHIRVRVRNVSIVAPGTDWAEFFLRRVHTIGAAVEFFDFGTGTWGAPVFWQPLPNTGPVGEFVYDGVPVDVDATYDIGLGRRTSAPMVSPASFVFGLVSKQFALPGFVSTGHRPELATLASSIQRVGESWTQDNSGAATFWHRDRGAGLFEFRPYFRADLIDPGRVHPIARAQNVGAGFDALAFVAAAGVDTIVFQRWTDALVLGADAQVEIRDAGGGILDLSRDYVVRCVILWNGPEGSQQEAPYQVNLGVAIFDANTGDFVSFNSSSAPGVAMDGVEDVFFLGHDLTPRYLDSWMRTYEVKRNPVFGLESAWRR